MRISTTFTYLVKYAIAPEEMFFGESYKVCHLGKTYLRVPEFTLIISIIGMYIGMHNAYVCILYTTRKFMSLQMMLVPSIKVHYEKNIAV